MLRRCLSIAVLWLLVACSAPARAPASDRPSGDTALRIRIARAEARRAGGLAELAELALRGSKPERLLALRGLGRIGTVGSAASTGATTGQPVGERPAGHPIADPIELLLAALGDGDPEIVGAAAAALGVAASLDDRDLGASEALVAALGRIGAPGNTAVRAAEIGAVVESLGRAGNAAAQPALVAALGDARIAARAGLALGRHGRRKIALTEPARQALVTASASSDPAVRYAAVHALAREHEPPDHAASTAALVQRLGDPVAEIRAQAVAALTRRKAIEAARTSGGAQLDALLVDRDWRVAVEAVRALADSDEGRDAIATAIVRRFDELERGQPTWAHVVIEGERALATAARRPLVEAALGALATRAPAAPAIPALTRGWIQCLATAALERARPAPELAAVERCGLPDALRLPLVAELITADVGALPARRAALARLLHHGAPRVRAAGLAALAALWKSGEATDRALVIDAMTAALADREPAVAGAAAEAAGALYEAIGSGDHAWLDTAVVTRAETEHDPELGAALLALIGEHKLVAGAAACRGGLAGDPVRARAGAACLAALGEPVPDAPVRASALPPVDVAAVIGKRLRWRVTTTRGELVIALHPEIAPWAVATIVELTRRGFYNGVAFHRVVPDFVVQGGDPTESGSGGPGFTIPAEPATSLDGASYTAGGVGIADAGRDSGGSQWFVMHSRAPHLDGRYTWIGTVERGQAASDALLIGDRIERATVEASD